MTTTLDQQPRNTTSVPIHEALARRWSPRGFDAEYVLPEEDLTALGEAARWAPSAGNRQPTRFIVAARGTESFDRILGALMGFNQAWTPRASLLIVAIAELERDGKPLRWAEYDLGQAVAHLSIEAESRGLHVRQMGGFRVDELRAAFDLAPELEPVSLVAVGKLADAEDVPEAIRERDAAPRTRRDLAELTIVRDVRAGSPRHP
ncbi:nitroreductase family protein [Raineyella sp.]|uniref:nitroreductase family protein n=1 Tax=Raineyella sp. TaxID=1911550 RepID=UPI002B1EC833|nr:nitroreductase family protein [Raineyella sp.]MEA5155362.1 nitroreductase family protein [Raineyella sp.]